MRRTWLWHAWPWARNGGGRPDHAGKAMRSRPSVPEAHLPARGAYHALARDEAAFHRGQAGHGFRPVPPAVCVVRAMIELGRGHVEAAEAALRQGVGLGPGASEARLRSRPRTGGEGRRKRAAGLLREVMAGGSSQDDEAAAQLLDLLVADADLAQATAVAHGLVSTGPDLPGPDPRLARAVANC